MKPLRICLTPRLSGVGGMVSFQAKLAAGLERRGAAVSYDLDDPACDAILVIGGTRRLDRLWRAKRRGARIVQRLNGMNWLHRVGGFNAGGSRHFLRAEYGNWLLAFIRSRIADGIVYQSEFARGWWERVYGARPGPWRVVHNAVDLSIYTPHGEHERPANVLRLLLVEGSLMGGYELGLEHAVGLAERLSQAHRLKVELMIVGRVAPAVQAAWSARAAIPLRWAGLAPGERIPWIDRSAHLLYSADLNAACPNSVIEALACGLPVAAFDTGALPELVLGDAGRIASYGGDPWRLDPPDIAGLARAAAEILAGGGHFRQAARALAEQAYGLDSMVNRYLEALT
jgi:glycosyltransferase involved in cell wall biosynthesis